MELKKIICTVVVIEASPLVGFTNMCCLSHRRRKPDVKTITWEAEEESTKCESI